jgi:hypothetical protein
MMATVLDSVGINARSMFASQLAMASSLSSIKVDVFDVECVNVARNITQQRQADVDTEVRAASCYHGYTDRRDYVYVSSCLRAKGQWTARPGRDTSERELR